jgi:hypothetical protein
MLNSIALGIHEDIYGACGDLSRGECIDRAASRLCDYVFEALAFDWGISLPQKTLEAIMHVVAAAMVAQFEHDEEHWSRLIADICNGERGARPAEQERRA